MNRTLLFTVLLAAAGVAQAHDEQRIRDIDKVNGSITAEAGQFYGDLSTVNGGIDLQRGAKVEDVETVNGGIEAGDEVVARSVSTVNGGIRFGQRARIDGSVETINGGIFIDRGGNVRSNARALATTTTCRPVCSACAASIRRATVARSACFLSNGRSARSGKRSTLSSPR